MKKQTTNQRNLAILKDFLAGNDYESLAKENNLSGKSTVPINVLPPHYKFCIALGVRAYLERVLVST